MVLAKASCQNISRQEVHSLVDEIIAEYEDTGGMKMPEQFTDSAKQALRLARQTARACRHSYVGSEHLLLGLLKEPRGTAGVLLREAQVDQKKLLELMDRLIAEDGPVTVKERDGYTPRARGILENAWEDARLFGSDRAGTEHILLAILKDVECVAARLLHTMDVNLQKLYGKILDIMGVTDERYRDLMKNVRIAGEVSGGNTAVLDQYSRDLTDYAREGRIDPIVGRGGRSSGLPRF